MTTTHALMMNEVGIYVAGLALLYVHVPQSRYRVLVAVNDWQNEQKDVLNVEMYCFEDFE